MSDYGGDGNGQQRDVREGVEIFGRFSIANPKAFLPGGFESRVVAFTFSSERVDRLEVVGVSVDGKPIIIWDGDVLGATGVFAFFETLVIAWAIITVTGTFEGTAKLLPCSVSIGKRPVAVHGKSSLTNRISNR